MALPLDPVPLTSFTVTPVSRDCPAISATITLALESLAAGRAFRIERAELIVDATYAADPANFYAFTLQHAATAAATFSTQTSAQGAITAAVPAQMILAANTGNNLVIQGGEVLSLLATKNGAAANITPRIVVHGRYVV
jgi:hypothetical protein